MRGRGLVIGAEAFVRSSEHFGQTASECQREVGAGNTNLATTVPNTSSNLGVIDLFHPSDVSSR